MINLSKDTKYLAHKQLKKMNKVKQKELALRSDFLTFDHD